jgi:cytochrome c biogenesis protein CcmG/thiol:disulfide interchange protein DsbE
VSRSPRDRLRLVLALGIVALALAVVGAVLTVDLSPDPGPSASLTVVGRSPLLDLPAPALRLPTLAGDEVDLADFRGRPVLVNFWASWCIPCREEFPLYRDARDRHAAEGLEILGVVHDDDADSARAFAEEHDADWPMLLDAADQAWVAYKGVALPLTYYIDREGVVRAVSYGPPPSDVLEDLLARIL